MNDSKSFRLRQGIALWLATAILTALFSVWLFSAVAETSNTNKIAKPEPKQHKRPKKALTGAELYAIHCNRCHPERYAPERTDSQWKTILTHMRVRANLPAEQARTILKFLQEESGK